MSDHNQIPDDVVVCDNCNTWNRYTGSMCPKNWSCWKCSDGSRQGSNGNIYSGSWGSVYQGQQTTGEDCTGGDSRGGE